MESIKTRGMQAAERYLEHKGYEVVDGYDDYIVAKIDETICFVAVETVYENSGKDEPGAREYWENVAIEYLKDLEEFEEMSVRFDAIRIIVVGSERALLRHHINRFGDNEGI